MALTLLAPRERDGAISSDIGMDGVMVYVCRTPTVELDWAHRRGLPIVTVDQEPLADATSINVDDRTGGRLGAQHLVDLGHRRIGILTIEDRREENGERSPVRARMAGWRDVLEAAGIEPVVAQGVYLFSEPSYDASRAMLDRPDRPTGLLCLSDAFALDALRAANDLGLRVPEDLSIVGYDDSRYAQTARPALTTIRQDVTAKGKLAASALVRAIRDGVPAEPDRLLLPAELVVRDSTGPAPEQPAVEHVTSPRGW
jgi:DNA-binding LacI/PurR family transcriptional regulator